MSQVGDHTTCPCDTAGVKSCPGHISFCGNYDVFCLVCRHITPEHTLQKKSCSNAQGLQSHQSHIRITRLFLLYQMYIRIKHRLVNGSSRTQKLDFFFLQARRALHRVVFISHSCIPNQNIKAWCSTTDATIQRIISSLNIATWMTGPFCCKAEVLARYSLPKTKESVKFAYFLPTYVNNQDVNAHWAAQNAYANVTSLLINTQ